MRDRQQGGEPGAHGIADDVGVRDLQVVEQAAGVLRHLVGAVVGRVVELFAPAMAAVVVGDYPVAGPRQRLDPQGVAPVDPGVGGKAVDEQHRRALAHHLIGDLDPVRLKARHVASALTPALIGALDMLSATLTQKRRKV